ncbi:GNAT family N-acetyltransferase [Streptomyces sp. NPDC003703]|uniref:GNAT family N-acetyltransferase n=1 Tax=Streptomyces sp. NPDC003283 TaxID=3364681 RepID=UPI0036D02549
MTATRLAPPPRAAHPGLTTELVTDPRAFAALAPQWTRLAGHCAAATPFQSHTWLHSWWQSYGAPGRLRLLLVREGAELVAAAPLMLRRAPVPALVPLGGAISDYADVLIDDRRPGPAADALTGALAEAARTALIDLPEVRPGSAVEQVYDRWDGPRHRAPGSLCLELPALPLDGLVARLPSARAQRVRAQLRRLRALGVERRVVRPEEAAAAVRRLLALHRLQWQDRGVTPEHLRTRFQEHLARAAGPMARAGEAVVTEFRLDGEVVAVDLTLRSGSLLGGYLYGAHPLLRERKADVAVMLLEACAAHTGDGAPDTLSLLRGDEPYKHRWRPRPVANERLLLARRHTAPLLSAVRCATAGRTRARDLRARVRRGEGSGEGRVRRGLTDT